MVLGEGSLNRLIKTSESHHTSLIFRTTFTHHLAMVFYKDTESGAEKQSCDKAIHSSWKNRTRTFKVSQQHATYKEQVNIIHKGAPTNLLKIRLSQTVPNTKEWDLGEGRTSCYFQKNYETWKIYIYYYFLCVSLSHMHACDWVCKCPLRLEEGTDLQLVTEVVGYHGNTENKTQGLCKSSKRS